MRCLCLPFGFLTYFLPLGILGRNDRSYRVPCRTCRGLRPNGNPRYQESFKISKSCPTGESIPLVRRLIGVKIAFNFVLFLFLHHHPSPYRTPYNYGISFWFRFAPPSNCNLRLTTLCAFVTICFKWVLNVCIYNCWLCCFSWCIFPRRLFPFPFPHVPFPPRSNHRESSWTEWSIT